MSTALFNLQVLQQVAKDGHSYTELTKRMAQELLKREESKVNYDAPETSVLDVRTLEVDQASVWIEISTMRKFYVRRIE